MMLEAAKRRVGQTPRTRLATAAPRSGWQVGAEVSHARGCKHTQARGASVRARATHASQHGSAARHLCAVSRRGLVIQRVDRWTPVSDR